MTTILHPVPTARPDEAPLDLEHVACCVCGAQEAEPVAVGEDFEYATSPDRFVAMRCSRCGLVYLNPRPAAGGIARIYPPSYHAYDFSPERFGMVFRVRRRLEAHRLLRDFPDLPDDARILDVGCGDGFHLELLRDFGKPGWTLHGIDASRRSVDAATAKGLDVCLGTAEEMPTDGPGYDLVLLIATIEHVADPRAVLGAVHKALKPGGRALVVTDNTDTADFRLFRERHWGGYHFPRHFNLFDSTTLQALAVQTGLEPVWLRTSVSPVNWTYSVRNWLQDLGAPRVVYDRFSLRSPLALAFFTAVDAGFQLFGRGTLLRACLRRPLRPIHAQGRWP